MTSSRVLANNDLPCHSVAVGYNPIRFCTHLVSAQSKFVGNRSLKVPGPLPYSKHIVTPLVLGACCTLLLTACSSTEEQPTAVPYWLGSRQLEFPPDLTTPQVSKDTHRYSAATREASAEELAEYE